MRLARIRRSCRNHRRFFLLTFESPAKEGSIVVAVSGTATVGIGTIAAAGAGGVLGEEAEGIGELVWGVEGVGVAVEGLRVSDCCTRRQRIDARETPVRRVVVSRLGEIQAGLDVAFIAGKFLADRIRGGVAKSARPFDREHLFAVRLEITSFHHHPTLIRRHTRAAQMIGCQIADSRLLRHLTVELSGTSTSTQSL